MPGLIALIVATLVAAAVITTLYLPLTLVVFFAVALVVYPLAERLLTKRVR